MVDASDYLIDKARDAIGLRSKWFVITRYGGLAFFAFVGVVISAFDDWLTCFACWLVFCFAFFMLIKKLEEHSKWAAEHKRYKHRTFETMVLMVLVWALFNGVL